MQLRPEHLSAVWWLNIYILNILIFTDIFFSGETHERKLEAASIDSLHT